MPRSAYYYVRQQYFCSNCARQTVLILYTIDASLCRCTSAVIYINGPQLGEVVRKENLVMDGRLNAHVAQGERNWYALWLWGEVGKGEGGWVSLFSLLFACISKKVFLSALNILRRPWLMLMHLSSCLQVLISYSGWSRTWTSKIKVKTADQVCSRDIFRAGLQQPYSFFLLKTPQIPHICHAHFVECYLLYCMCGELGETQKCTLAPSHSIKVWYIC